MSTQLPKVWDLPVGVVAALGAHVQEQRAFLHEGHLLLVLHPADGIQANEPAIFWRQPSGAWKCTDGGSPIASLSLLVDAYDREAQELVKKLEAAHVARHFYDVLVRVRPLAYRAADLARTLGEAAERVAGDADLDHHWARAKAAARSLELVVLRAQDARGLDLAQLSEDQADISNQMVVSSQRLNFLIAMLLPMTAFASIFGMNLFHGADDGSTGLFWAVVIVSLLIGAALSLFVGRMPRQLRRESHLENLVAELEARKPSGGTPAASPRAPELEQA